MNMRQDNRKKDTYKNQGIIKLATFFWSAILGVMFFAVMLAGCGEVTEQPGATTLEATTEATVGETTAETTVAATDPQQTEEIAEPTEETYAVVSVEILNYEFALSEQLAEKIFCRELADTDAADVEVYTKLSGQEYTLFTIVFNSVEGDIVHMLDSTEGERTPVAFVMNTLPEDLPDADAGEFYIAQSAVNDVIASLKAK